MVAGRCSRALTSLLSIKVVTSPIAQRNAVEPHTVDRTVLADEVVSFVMLFVQHSQSVLADMEQSETLAALVPEFTELLTKVEGLTAVVMPLFAISLLCSLRSLFLC
jgi:hypothetical protein